MFVAVDKQRIFKVVKVIPKEVDPMTIEEMKDNVLGYQLAGEICEFYIDAKRCVEVDNEYVIKLNLYGFSNAMQYAREKVYIE